MRRVLSRYLFLECLPPLGLSLAAFAFALLMQRFLILSDLVVTKGVGVGEVLWLLALALPGLLPLLLPVSLLLAILLAVGRLSADSEIVAMRACGVGLAQNLRPVIALSVLVGAVTALASLWAQPLAFRMFKEAVYESVKNRISLTTQTGVFSEIANGVTVYAEKIDDRTGTLGNLFLHMERDATPGIWILARSGTLRQVADALELDLREGEMHQHGGEERPYRLLRFDSYRLQVPLPKEVWVAGDEERPTEVLARRAYGPEHDAAARLELHRRLALPVSCLVFGVLGASLGLHHFRGGRSRGAVVGLAVLLAFYALLALGRTLGKQGMLPPEVAMWTPDLVLGAFAAYVYARRNRDAPLPLEEAVQARLSRLWKALHAGGKSP